ncbi:type II toxin-antitoxin system RelE/ParE family toxin [Mariniphaga sp.]|uniref:type II toxin-antitoxin system RelE/ParE family toxin n=1 Tax=Mariniphaga sp. TaxID=1954475 RepID=UPI0035636BEC
MSYNVYPTPYFKKLFKKLYKKHPSLKSDLNDLIQTLKEKPDFGIPMGSNIFKIRLAVTSKRKGKSGGARIITYLVTEHKEIYLVYIYDKSQLENITKEQILELLKSAGLSI